MNTLAMLYTGLLLVNPALCTTSLPLGVHPSNASLYKSQNGYFHCVSDPSIKIPFDRVNDDYCDCPDGSDEPGTSACSRGRFWCPNAGHIGQYIPSRFVNDGKCDSEACCDGSDEAPGVCPNVCKEVAARHAAAEQERKRVYNAGLKARELLVVTARELRAEIEQQITALENEVLLKQDQLKDAQRAHTELMEASARGELTDTVDRELEAKFEAARQTIRMAYGMLHDLKQKYTEQKLHGEQLATVLEIMKRDYNPNFNDAAVKQALHSFEDLTTNANVEDGDSVNLIMNMELSVDDALEYVDALYVKPSGAPVQTAEPKSYIADLVEQAADWLIDHHVLPPRKSPSSRSKPQDQTSKKVKDAQALVAKIEREIEDVQNKVNGLKHSVAQHKGPDDVLRALEKVCIQSKFGEYDYNICFFDRVTQNGNGHFSNMGSFSEYEILDDRVVFKYTDGAQCWQGPKRSATVNMRCGEQNELVQVSEIETCIYSVDVLSPAACIPEGGAQADTEKAPEHTEL